jgi:NADH-quinone oxidoreductase subunit I
LDGGRELTGASNVSEDCSRLAEASDVACDDRSRRRYLAIALCQRFSTKYRSRQHGEFARRVVAASLVFAALLLFIIAMLLPEHLTPNNLYALPAVLPAFFDLWTTRDAHLQEESKDQGLDERLKEVINEALDLGDAPPRGRLRRLKHDLRDIQDDQFRGRRDGPPPGQPQLLYFLRRQRTRDEIVASICSDVRDHRTPGVGSESDNSRRFPYLSDESVVAVQRGPEPGGVGGAYRAFGETLRGLKTTFARIIEGPVTIQYPEEKTPVYPRFRGRHKLHKFEDTGLEKCVGCSLCAAACPADCIRVVAAENDPENRVSAGERYAEIYEINLARCIFCGYCEVACPFDAITMGHEYEMADYNREDLVFTKEMLLAEPVERAPLRREGE